MVLKMLEPVQRITLTEIKNQVVTLAANLLKMKMMILRIMSHPRMMRMTSLRISFWLANNALLLNATCKRTIQGEAHASRVSKLLVRIAKSSRKLVRPTKRTASRKIAKAKAKKSTGVKCFQT